MLTDLFDRALGARLPGAVRQEPDGDALAGGHLLATRPDLPHLAAGPPGPPGPGSSAAQVAPGAPGTPG
ncbi:hypothetical protein LEP48_14330 [Isoptericola sp. NEAU-Y5]|uniref:Uncharacterized protein n=1 Tax=Isoptericola luteus TaxID=2879484 RepID=A0ABS7ZL61_9MICO|nr:hypothetical protein [Isoptericola sp. NEAU-Y5]MCA5894515.1 hypothetical protein [Isoptericola sp. NEAU-Y5]